MGCVFRSESLHSPNCTTLLHRCDDVTSRKSWAWSSGVDNSPKAVIPIFGPKPGATVPKVTTLPQILHRTPSLQFCKAGRG